MTALEGPRAKVQRGREHLQSLYGELEEALLQPLSFDRRWAGRAQGPDGRVYPVLEVFISEVAEIPLRCGVILGDALHNFRSALDHLAWQLVLANGATPTNQTQFPITTSPARFAEQRRRVQGMAPEVVQEIETLQPYEPREGPEFTALGHLRDLSNRDKHQLVNLVLMGLGQMSPDIRFVGCHAEGVWINPRLVDAPLQVGTPVAGGFIVPEGPNPDVRFEIEYGVFAALPELAETESIDRTLVRISMCAEGIVERFADRFFS
jgi:hypothetical protein